MHAIILWLAVGVIVFGLAAWRWRHASDKAAALKTSREAIAAATIAAARAEAQRLAIEKTTREAARVEADRVVAAHAARVQASRTAEAERAAREAARRAVLEANKEQAEIAARQAAEQAAQEAARAEAEAARAEEARRAAAMQLIAPPAPVETAKTPEQTLILVADDSKVVRIKAGRLLAQHGYRVMYAVDGLDAVRQLEVEVPDLVVTDVEMPGMDGFGLTRHLRGDARTAHVPIVMITSADAAHREPALREGVSLVLGKPFPEEPLLEHIRSFSFPHGAPAASARVPAGVHAGATGWAQTQAGALA